MERKGIEDLEIYNISMTLADDIWFMVKDWDALAKNTMGYQIIRSSDSIGANLSEGYGRYSFKENRQFCYIARGSLYETLTFINKSFRRKLIEIEKYEKLKNDLEILLKKLNAYIKYIESHIKLKS